MLATVRERRIYQVQVNGPTTDGPAIRDVVDGVLLSWERDRCASDRVVRECANGRASPREQQPDDVVPRGPPLGADPVGGMAEEDERRGPAYCSRARSSVRATRSATGASVAIPSRSSAIRRAASSLTASIRSSSFDAKWCCCAPRDTPARRATEAVERAP